MCCRKATWGLSTGSRCSCSSIRGGSGSVSAGKEGGKGLLGGDSPNAAASSLGQGTANCGPTMSQVHLPPVFVQPFKLRTVLTFSKVIKNQRRLEYATETRLYVTLQSLKYFPFDPFQKKLDGLEQLGPGKEGHPSHPTSCLFLRLMLEGPAGWRGEGPWSRNAPCRTCPSPGGKVLSSHRKTE